MSRNQKSVVLICLFLLSAMITALLISKLPLRAGKYPHVQKMADFSIPQSSEFYFVHSRRAELSQSILYHDLDDSMENARLADIIFIGDSRVPLGLREEFLGPQARKIGVKLFSLGFGHVEKAKFGLELIRKFDLKPKVVVVAGGPFVFEDSMSEVAEQAMQMSRWDAAKHWFEAAGWWNIKLRLHSLVPKIEFFDGRLHANYIHYRSSRTGWWKTVLEPNGRGEIGYIPERKNYDRYLPMAREFKREMDRIGALLVLSIVPYGNMQVGHLPYFSNMLAAPVVVPDFSGLSLADGSHLNRDSARQYSEAFWDELLKLPEVRARLSLDPITSP